MAKRKYDEADREEQPEARLRSGIVGKHAEHNGHPADTKLEFKLTTRVQRNKDELRVDDWDKKEHECPEDTAGMKRSLEGEGTLAIMKKVTNIEGMEKMVKSYSEKVEGMEEETKKSKEVEGVEEGRKKSEEVEGVEERRKKSKKSKVWKCGRGEEEERGRQRQGRWEDVDQGSKGKEWESKGITPRE